jgi:hypothetical protein
MNHLRAIFQKKIGQMAQAHPNFGEENLIYQYVNLGVLAYREDCLHSDYQK